MKKKEYEKHRKRLNVKLMKLQEEQRDLIDENVSLGNRRAQIFNNMNRHNQEWSMEEMNNINLKIKSNKDKINGRIKSVKNVEYDLDRCKNWEIKD